jgi:hypothetical protein
LRPLERVDGVAFGQIQMVTTRNPNFLEIPHSFIPS